MLGVVHPDGVRDPARVRGRHVEVRVGVRVDIYLVPDITIRLDTIYVCNMLLQATIIRNYFVKTQTSVASFSPPDLSIIFSNGLYLEVSPL